METSKEEPKSPASSNPSSEVGMRASLSTIEKAFTLFLSIFTTSQKGIGVEIAPSEITFIEKISSTGTQGVIYKAKVWGIDVAVKEIKLSANTQARAAIEAFRGQVLLSR